MKQFLRRWLQIPADTKTKIYELERLVLEINTRTRPKKPCANTIWSGENLDNICLTCGWEWGYHGGGMKHTFNKSDYHCPNCGEKRVYEEYSPGGGDYYVGVPYICTACGHLFYMSALGAIEAGDWCAEDLAGLREKESA